MINRVINKSILLISISTIYAILIKKGIDQTLVAAFLFALIVLVLGELIRSQLVAVVVLIAFAAVGRYWPEYVLVYPVALFNVFSAKAMLQERLLDKRLILGAITLALSVGIIINGGDMITTALALSYMLVSIVMAYGCQRQEYIETEFFRRFDDMRYEAMTAMEQRSAAFKQNEENVYMATLKERNRIAREIHDNVGHMLTRAIVQMQALKVVSKDETLKPLIEGVDDTINQAMLNIRKSVHELHDDSLDMSMMLGEIVRTIPDSFKVKLKTSIESAASTDIKNTIVAIVREAVTNIVKYSKGNQVKVELVEHAAFWRVLVWDNGPCETMDYAYLMRDKSAKSGMGLMSIYQRTARFGGNVNIRSNEDGFTVLVTIPKGDR